MVANASEYERLIAHDLLHSRGRRSSLTDEERKTRRRKSAALSMEARRRASAVLIARYKGEYNELYEQERAVLVEDPRYQM